MAISFCVRSTFLHVVLPGQEEGAEDLGEGAKYPSMQDLGEDLDSVLDQLNIQFVVGLGEGAGANILARWKNGKWEKFVQTKSRFGMAHPTRCLGLILVHPTSTPAGVMEQFKVIICFPGKHSPALSSSRIG